MSIQIIGVQCGKLVAVYRGLEDYETAYEYAKSNYLHDSENPYQIQPFFEILVRKSIRSDTEIMYIEDMLAAIRRINDLTPTATFYEIFAQYYAFIERDKNAALSIIHDGAKRFSDSSYILRTWFDCSEYFRDIPEMQRAIQLLEPMSDNSKATKVAFNIRQSVLFAYEKKPLDFIHNTVNGINGLNDDAKQRIRMRTSAIISGHTFQLL